MENCVSQRGGSLFQVEYTQTWERPSDRKIDEPIFLNRENYITTSLKFNFYKGQSNANHPAPVKTSDNAIARSKT